MYMIGAAGDCIVEKQENKVAQMTERTILETENGKMGLVVGIVTTVITSDIISQNPQKIAHSLTFPPFESPRPLKSKHQFDTAVSKKAIGICPNKTNHFVPSESSF